MDIDRFLFKEEALKGEKTALKFRWILIFVIIAFIIVTVLKGDYKEALFSLIPATVFLIYNLYLGFLIRTGRNFYFLRYFSVSIDILALSVHIYINSVFFSTIAVSTTATILVYPILMFLSVLRYDKKLIIYATLLTIVCFNLNYYLRLHTIDKELIAQVISSDPMGHFFKSAYFLLLGIFFLQVPDMVSRYIGSQRKILLKKNKSELSLTIEKKEKEILQANLGEVEKLNIELNVKNQKIKDQNLQLNELLQTKDKLMTFISHDLRNSFSTMTSIIETFSDSFEKLEANDIRAAMQVLSRHAKNNYQLFENLLHWARSQHEDLPVKKEMLNLSEILHKQRTKFVDSLSNKQLELKVRTEKDLKAFADQRMLNSIVGNILSNAIKFTPGGGSIEIDGVAGANSTMVKISDTGVGISEERLSKMFEIGGIESTKGTNGESGSGFGLILCKEMIDKCGGKIDVKSQPGKGSVFSIMIPNKPDNGLDR